MDPDRHQDQHQDRDHSSMQMNHADGADSECCHPERSDAPGDCAGFMSCGTCPVAPSMIASPVQAAPACLRAEAVDIASGQIVPPHSSPPYRPPIS
jgi:hypothetical protein